MWMMKERQECEEMTVSSLVSQWRGVLAIKVEEQEKQSFRFIKMFSFEHDFAGIEGFPGRNI